MAKRVLVTGGAGFIGSHLSDALLARGHEVRALDNLSAQVHGGDATRPAYLDDRVELLVGDVRDRTAVRRALEGIDVVFHLAAAVGVGQSMYEIVEYTDVNNIGTSTLLEELSKSPVERLVVASSMSLYGEGRYETDDGRIVDDAERNVEDLRRGHFDPRIGQSLLRPLPTPEEKPAVLSSVYALSKHDQERMCLLMGRAYGIDTVALRFFNVYGPRQALSNPYTGVLAIFGARLLNGRRPVVFEDGKQRRDFVSVYDVAEACCLAMERDDVVNEVFNIGSGRSVSVAQLAHRMALLLDKGDLEPDVTGRHRVGDVRHCYADIGKAQSVLGFTPSVALEDGMRELCDWLRTQTADDRVDEARRELEQRGLTL